MTNDRQPSQAPSCAKGQNSCGERRWKRPEVVYLGLGSNLGDREADLREAVERIKRLGLEIARASSIYETEPVGYRDQPWFLNQVIEVRVDLKVTFESEPEWDALLKAEAEEHPDTASRFWVFSLLRALQSIEREMGRKRDIPDGPRVIDIDVLIYGEDEGFFVETQGNNNEPARAAGPPLLSLPHPRMHERRFVLEPLCEIAPDLMHPTLKQTCRELLAALDDASIVRLYRSAQ